MHIGHIARAIGFSRDGIEESRTDDIADLDTGVVLTVSEGRQLENARINSR